MHTGKFEKGKYNPLVKSRRENATAMYFSPPEIIYLFDYHNI